MRTIGIMICLLTTCSLAGQESPPSTWFRDPAAARKAATKEGKVLLIYAIEPASAWSAKFEQVTLANARVAHMMREFVLLKVVSQDAGANEILMKHKIGRFPTIVFELVNGTRLGELVDGFHSPERFISVLSRTLENPELLSWRITSSRESASESPLTRQ